LEVEVTQIKDSLLLARAENILASVLLEAESSKQRLDLSPATFR
jgi:hypothetical protein